MEMVLENLTILNNSTSKGIVSLVISSMAISSSFIYFSFSYALKYLMTCVPSRMLIMINFDRCSKTFSCMSVKALSTSEAYPSIF